MKKLLKVLFLGTLWICIFAGVAAGTFYALYAFFDNAPDLPASQAASQGPPNIPVFVNEIYSEYIEEDDNEEEEEEPPFPTELHIVSNTAQSRPQVPAQAQTPNTTDGVVDNSLLPWNLVLVNRYNFLSADFQVDLAAIGGGHYIDARAARNVSFLLESARDEGLSPLVVSSHRSMARQRFLFDAQLERNLNAGMSQETAFDAARRVIAYPGSSEHNLGLAIDIVSYNHRGLNAAFGQTPEGLWLAQNAHRFGFILRYPDDKQDITNIIYEPWHFRYVGVLHATRMFEMNLVLEEYVLLFLRGEFDNE